MLDGKTVLVTGGTGSFGTRFIEMTLAKYNPRKIIVFSRDEMKQWHLNQRFKGETRLRFFIGDVRDRERVYRAFNDVDIVVHAAATKIVPTAEYNPFECIKTNIMGAMNVIDAAIDRKVECVVALSTDKACAPINLYGATKLASDKVFIAGNYYAAFGDTKFSVVRYGNVMGSRGSVIPFFYDLRNTGSFPITHPEMTRFMITLDQGVELVWTAIETGQGGEIYVRKIPSMRVVDIAAAINPVNKLNVVGVRPGEKIHEQMIVLEDAPCTFEYKEYYKIIPNHEGWHNDEDRVGDGKRVDPTFYYSSQTNKEWLSKEALQEWITRHVGDL